MTVFGGQEKPGGTAPARAYYVWCPRCNRQEGTLVGGKFTRVPCGCFDSGAPRPAAPAPAAPAPEPTPELFPPASPDPAPEVPAAAEAPTAAEEPDFPEPEADQEAPASDAPAEPVE